MTKDFVRKVMKEDAESNRPGNPDLWPAVHGGLPQTGTPQLQPRRRSRVRLGLMPLALAGVLVVALLGLGLLMPSTLTQPRPASAAELLARAAASEGTAAGMRSFHGVLVGEQRNNAREEFSNVREEQWYLAPHSYRSEAHIRTNSGEEGVLMWVSNGKAGWKYDSYFGTAYPLKPNEVKGNFGALNLEKALSGEMTKSFYNAEVVGTEKVSGRTAHVVDLTLKPAEQWPPNMYPSDMAHTKLWVDAEVFIILRLQSWDAEGNLLSTNQYEIYEINAAVDPEIFNAKPPAR